MRRRAGGSWQRSPVPDRSHRGGAARIALAGERNDDPLITLKDLGQAVAAIAATAHEFVTSRVGGDELSEEERHGSDLTEVPGRPYSPHHRGGVMGASSTQLAADHAVRVAGWRGVRKTRVASVTLTA